MFATTEELNSARRWWLETGQSLDTGEMPDDETIVSAYRWYVRQPRRPRRPHVVWSRGWSCDDCRLWGPSHAGWREDASHWVPMAGVVLLAAAALVALTLAIVAAIV